MEAYKRFGLFCKNIYNCYFTNVIFDRMLLFASLLHVIGKQLGDTNGTHS
jgi:hypothetical protein